MKLEVDVFSMAKSTQECFKKTCGKEHVKILDQREYQAGTRYLVELNRDGRIFLPCKGEVSLPSILEPQFNYAKPKDLMGLITEEDEIHEN